MTEIKHAKLLWYPMHQFAVRIKQQALIYFVVGTLLSQEDPVRPFKNHDIAEESERVTKFLAPEVEYLNLVRLIFEKVLACY